MKHEIISLNTKKSLAAALKKQMEKKPFSKITVSGLTADCGINRKTFYYHFEDIYDLLQWTLEQEALQILQNFDPSRNFEEMLNSVLEYMEQNKHLINCLYNSIGHDELKRFLFTDFLNTISSLVTSMEHRLDAPLEEPFRQFLIQFYATALAGTLVDALKNKKEFNRQELIDNITFIFKHSLESILLSKADEQKGGLQNRVQQGSDDSCSENHLNGA